MQAARASDKVAYQSQSLPVVDIRRTYHMRAQACMWREACSVVGSRQGSSGEKVGTGNKAFVGEALAPSDLNTLKFSPLWESPKYPSCHQPFLIEQQEMRPGVKGGKLKEMVRKKV